jgi:MSHA pilin protein MshC
MRVRGFTLIEIIVVMMLISILAVVALPRFFGAVTFSARGFVDEAKGMLRYAQKLAIARRANVYVSVSGGSIQLCFDPLCAEPVLDPAVGTGSFSKTVPSGVTLTASSAVFSFDALGKPVPDSAVTLTVSADTSHTITVERETGYVH